MNLNSFPPSHKLRRPRRIVVPATNATELYYTIPYHTKPNQTKPNQTIRQHAPYIQYCSEEVEKSTASMYCRVMSPHAMTCASRNMGPSGIISRALRPPRLHRIHYPPHGSLRPLVSSQPTPILGLYSLGTSLFAPHDVPVYNTRNQYA